MSLLLRCEAMAFVWITRQRNIIDNKGENAAVRFMLFAMVIMFQSNSILESGKKYSRVS